MAKTLMILGTASDVGKSLVVTGLCRFFARSGVRVAPFKAQNMSNNAYVCLDGGEIGWAQALQAWACGLEPCVDMNPVLLKPTTECTSQLIVQGRVQGMASACRSGWERLRAAVRTSFLRLSRAYDLILLEGAGSAAEMNLKDRDFVNFAMAEMADAPVILVADIERGGVFAALVGTLELSEPTERARVRGCIINKFHGALEMLEPGVRLLEERTGKPVLGVLPYLADLNLEAEDAVSLEIYRKQQPAFSSATVNIAVIALPWIANFTDFLPLARIEAVALNYVTTPAEIAAADVVILPGSKNTIADLRWLKAGVWPGRLQQSTREGKWLVGVCGGYQMLGEEIQDPFGIEGRPTRETGLGFLPVRTVLTANKTSRRVEAAWQIGTRSGVFSGYEIHMGRTTGSVRGRSRFFVRPSGQGEWTPDGCISQDGQTWGTYLHGLFESGPFVHEWLTQVGAARGIRVQPGWSDWYDERTTALDRLADVLEDHLDMAALWNVIQAKEGML